MERKDPRLATIKALFARCGNRCAFPDCSQVLVDDRNILVGEVCHIKAVRKKDARFDDFATDDELRDYDNLILLCHAHHRRIDTLPTEHPVDMLLAMKATHEARYLNAPFVVPESALIDALLQAAGLHHKILLEQAIDFLERELEAQPMGQQGLNLITTNIGAILDAYTALLFLLLLQHTPDDQKMALVQEQDAWRALRNSQADASVQMTGGTGGILEYNGTYIDLTRERITILEDRLYGPLEPAN